jgi:hypothetical protein
MTIINYNNGRISDKDVARQQKPTKYVNALPLDNQGACKF